MIFSRNVTKLLFVGLISLSSLPALAVVRLSDLGPLEVRFFSHQYERETPVERLDRLERLVFGNVQSGSIEERVARISKTVDVATPGKPDTSIATQAKADQAASQISKPSPSDLSNSEYPRVTELERSLLGRTYTGEPVRQRLSRLESKAYGAPSRIDDLATRVDNLSSYAGVYGMQPGDLMNNISAPLRGATGITGTTQDGSSGMLEKVSAMEVKLLGHANSNHSLVQRIKDLESKVLGSAARSPVDDMTTRVSTLWARTQMGLPQSPQAPQSPSQAATAQTLQSAPFSSSQYNRNWNSSNSYVAGANNPFGSGPTSSSSATSNNGYSPQGLDPYAGRSGAGAGYSSMQNSGAYNSSPFMASSSNPQFANSSKHKSKGKHSSLLGKIGKVVAIAGSAAVGAGGLAVGAMSSMNMGYYGMGMGSGFGSPYSYSSFAPAYSAYSSYPGYGSVSTIGTLGSMGSSFGSPFGSSYAGSFFSP